jgi:hypothetical protein
VPPLRLLFVLDGHLRHDPEDARFRASLLAQGEPEGAASQEDPVTNDHSLRSLLETG